MLTFDPAIFNPEERPAALEAVADKLGLEGETRAAVLETIGFALDLASPDNPDTTSEYLEVIGRYLGMVVIGTASQILDLVAQIDALSARVDALTGS